MLTSWFYSILEVKIINLACNRFIYMGIYVGRFDIIVILILVFINIKFWDKEWGCLVQILGTLLYVFVFPLISMGVEAEIWLNLFLRCYEK